MTEARDSSTRRHAHTRRGFSLVELLLVIALMGIMAGILIPRFDPSLHEQLDAAAHIVAADLSYARNLAVINNSTYAITFDFTENRYSLQHSGTNSLLDTLPTSPFQEFGAADDEHITDFDDVPTIGPRVALVAAHKLSPSEQNVGDVEFASLGETTRAEETRIWLSCGGGDSRLFVFVRVDPVTGLATVGDIQTSPPPIP